MSHPIPTMDNSMQGSRESAKDFKMRKKSALSKAMSNKKKVYYGNVHEKKGDTYGGLRKGNRYKNNY